MFTMLHKTPSGGLHTKFVLNIVRMKTMKSASPIAGRPDQTDKSSFAARWHHSPEGYSEDVARKS